MSQKLYLECNSGISGDMTVAALLDLGADEKVLREALASLPLSGYEVEITRVKKAGIDCCDFNVKLEHENHDHDMEYLHGHDHDHHMHGEEAHCHDHVHGEEGHCHDHAHGDHAHGHEEHCHDHVHGDHVHGAEEHSHAHVHHHHHEHRGLPEIEQILRGGALTEGALKLALRIFHILREAESKAHGVPMDQVHFHEVGAVDSIVDIAAAAICLDNLGVEEVIVPRLCEGQGTVRCQHGILSVPVPAVANILERYGLRVQIMNLKGEFITPTGAAIAAAVQTSDKLPEEFIIRKIGLGAGKREYERPGMLRAMLIEA